MKIRALWSKIVFHVFSIWKSPEVLKMDIFVDKKNVQIWILKVVLKTPFFAICDHNSPFDNFKKMPQHICFVIYIVE